MISNALVHQAFEIDRSNRRTANEHFAKTKADKLERSYGYGQVIQRRREMLAEFRKERFVHYR